jgi:NHLM bacteriocin system ABC transporter, ATP-binding protein
MLAETPASLPPPPSDPSTVRRLAGHEHLLLDDETQGFLVRTGYLSVYLVQLVDGQPSGPRRYLLTVHEGALLHGTRAEIDGHTYALLAVTVSECDYEVVQIEGWGRNETEILAVNHWCDRLCHLIEEQTSSTYAERADASGTFIASAERRVRAPVAGLFLLTVQRGSLALYDQPPLLAKPSDGPLLLLGDSWLLATEESEGTFTAVPTTGGTIPDLPAGIRQLVRLFIGHVHDLQQREAAAERERLARLASLREKQNQEAVEHLSFAREESSTIRLRETPLMTCLDLLSASTGVKLETDPPPRPTLSLHEQIQAVTRVSGTRTRKVALDHEWWHQDGGDLLGFKKEGETPVVLLNASKHAGLERHYDIVDPTTGQRTELTPEIAATLSETAYVFLRPLPTSDKPISVFDLSKFSFKPFLKDIRLILILSVVGGLLGIIMPYANRLMVDEVIPDANRRLLVDLAFGLTAMSLALFFFSMSQGLVSLRVKTALAAHLQSAVIDRLLRLPPRFFRRYTSGDLLNRSMIITTVSAGLSMTVMSAVFGLISTLIMLGLCFYYSRPLAFLALIAAAITSVFSLSFSFIIRTRALQLELRRGTLFGMVVQMIHGVSKLQVANAEGRAFNQWAKEYGDQLRVSYRMAYLQHWSGLINTAIQTTSTIALYYLSGKMVEESEQLRAISPLIPPLLTIGTFFAVQGAFSAVVGGIVSFFSTFITVHQQMEKRKLVRPILDEPVEGGQGRIDPGRLDGHIMMKQVCFRYGGANAPLILNNVDLQTFPGEFVALVGPSGSGKTTLLKLLLGFETPESGQILFDKKDVKDLDLTAVRRQTGVVLQDGRISAGTVFHNIAGATQISIEDAWEAAEDAGFAEDVRGMPMQMHTLLPEGGTTLSGGQRQRLLIARALAVKPRIIFFDEATSALDNRTQEIVTESLKRRQITRIVVAHRLTTIMDADRIYVLDRGAVVQKGTFKELMAVEGMFKQIASRQLE